MKALYFEEHGERDVLRYGDLPDIQNKEDHVLIKVEAADEGLKTKPFLNICLSTESTCWK